MPWRDEEREVEVEPEKCEELYKKNIAIINKNKTFIDKLTDPNANEAEAMDALMLMLERAERERHADEVREKLTIFLFYVVDFIYFSYRLEKCSRQKAS